MAGALARNAAIVALTVLGIGIAQHSGSNPWLDWGTAIAKENPQTKKPAEEHPGSNGAHEAVPGSTMTPARMGAIVRGLDEQAKAFGTGWQFQVRGRQLTLIYDEKADRMRIVSPVAAAGAVDSALAMRLLQADFDSALDARYAIAQDVLWSVYLHPLSTLTDRDLVSGIAQTVTLVDTFGTTFSSGLFIFGGGDSEKLLQHELEEELAKKRPSL